MSKDKRMDTDALVDELQQLRGDTSRYGEALWSLAKSVQKALHEADTLKKRLKTRRNEEEDINVGGYDFRRNLGAAAKSLCGIAREVAQEERKASQKRMGQPTLVRINTSAENYAGMLALSMASGRLVIISKGYAGDIYDAGVEQPPYSPVLCKNQETYDGMIAKALQ